MPTRSLFTRTDQARQLSARPTLSIIRSGADTVFKGQTNFDRRVRAVGTQSTQTVQTGLSRFPFPHHCVYPWTRAI